MTKCLIPTGTMTAVAAVALMLSAFSASAQERGGLPAGMGPGSGPHMMAQNDGSGGDAAKGTDARRDDRRSRREQRRERRHARRFARHLAILDTDNDGKVTLAEIHGEQKRLMGAADVNGDGKLSVEEFRRRGRWFIRLRTISFFDMLDTDGDGQISEKEMTAPSARWFTRYDENKDKALDREEFGKSGWRGHRRGGRGSRR